jgi:hypothetical protein
MDLSASREPDPPISSLRDRAGGIVATAVQICLDMQHTEIKAGAGRAAN